MGVLQNVTEALHIITGHYGTLQSILGSYGTLRKHYRVLWGVTEHYRVLRDVMEAPRIVMAALRSFYGTQQNRYRKHRFCPLVTEF